MGTVVRALSLACLVLSLAACGGSGGGKNAGPQLGDPPTETLIVTNHDDAGPGSLRQAIEDALPGAWIQFDPALPAGTVPLESPLVIDKVLSIGGLSGLGFRHGISGQYLHRVLVVQNSALQLNDVTLVAGDATEGGAIAAYDAEVVCWRTHFVDNTASDRGGAVRVDSSAFSAYDSFFAANGSESGGAISAFESELRIERTSFYLNESVSGGAALNMWAGTTTMVNCAVHENTSTSGFAEGGAISVYTNPSSSVALLRVFNGTISHNETAGSGGGIHVRGAAGQAAGIELHRTIVALNTAPSGPDIEYDGTASASGTYNLVGIGGGYLVDGADDNQVGNTGTPLDPMLLDPAVLAGDGRYGSLPSPAGPASGAVPAGANLSPEGVPMVVDLRFLPRATDLPTDIGALEV